MDKIVWDEPSLMRMLAELRRASHRLQDCCEELRAVKRQGIELFQGNRGLSQSILDQSEVAIRRAGTLAERTAELSHALQRVHDLVLETEQSLCFESRGGPLRLLSTPETNLVGRVQYVELGGGHSRVVPLWLQDAAERWFP